MTVFADRIGRARMVLRYLCLLSLALCPVVVAQEPTSQESEVTQFGNEDVVALSTAGLSEELIIQKIQTVPVEDLDASTEGILSMTDAGVSQSVIQAVLDRVAARDQSVQPGSPASSEPAPASAPAYDAAATSSDGHTRAQYPPTRSRDRRRDGGQARIQIVLDASGSMRGATGPQSKMEAAVSAIQSTVDAMKGEQLVALRAYGHRLPREQKEASCRDSELVIPFLPLDRDRFAEELDSLQPLGQTPLAYSLERAAADFGTTGSAQDVIILVSDGNETCGGDPVAVACNLARQGVQLTVHTIGFDVGADVRDQLRSIAHCTGGRYEDASNAKELAHSFESAIPEVAWAPRFGLQGFEVRGGLTSPSAFDTGFIVGANVDLGEIYDDLRLYPGFFYSSADFDQFGGSESVDVLAVGADVRYFFEPDLLGWYVGGGPYVHSYSYSVSGVDLGSVSAVGLVAVGGYNFSSLGVEARANTGFRHFAVLATFRFGASSR